MATAKKTGIVDRMKEAITGMFTSDGPASGRTKAPAKKAATKKAATKSVVTKKAATKPKAIKKAATKQAPSQRATAKKSASRPVATKQAPTKKRAVTKQAGGASAARDRQLIALTQDYEVRDWCASLGCSEAELAAAVNAVGHSAAKVREYLKSR